MTAIEKAAPALRRASADPDAFFNLAGGMPPAPRDAIGLTTGSLERRLCEAKDRRGAEFVERLDEDPSAAEELL